MGFRPAARCFQKGYDVCLSFLWPIRPNNWCRWVVYYFVLGILISCLFLCLRSLECRCLQSSIKKVRTHYPYLWPSVLTNAVAARPGYIALDGMSFVTPFLACMSILLNQFRPLSSPSSVRPVGPEEHALDPPSLFCVKHRLGTWAVRAISGSVSADHRLNSIAGSLILKVRRAIFYASSTGPCTQSFFPIDQSWPSGFSCYIRDQANANGSIAGNFVLGILVGCSTRYVFAKWLSRVVSFVGSVIAILGLPLTTLISRRNLETVCCHLSYFFCWSDPHF